MAPLAPSGNRFRARRPGFGGVLALLLTATIAITGWRLRPAETSVTAPSAATVQSPASSGVSRLADPSVAPPSSGPASSLPPASSSPELSLGDFVAQAAMYAEVALRGPSTDRRLELATTISGDISPKSVVASGDGVFFAQNMMYEHTITVYDRSHRLVETISDAVDLAEFGLADRSGTYRGAPVEAAFSPDGRYAYVSNYSMYGPGFDSPGYDACTPSHGIDESFLYRVDVASLRIDQVIPVGAVPKFVAVTPDGRFVLVTNWCSWDLSVIDAATGRPVERIGIGRYPRGIAVDPESATAYVAVMGSTSIAAVDLESSTVGWIGGVGEGPRHLVIDAAGRYLYVTLNEDGTVAKVDLEGRRIVARVTTGSAPRSVAIAEDGRSLYVVNYASSTVSKVRTEDMEILQAVETNYHPIGITYDTPTREVWVSCYGGTIMVFRDA